ncbi:MAG: prepilin-type N-terminal cleavage/methylation domain-containing protein [Planctomycetota bacterium]|nr:prepilin-type N-terminal cleavage/methylation domain-containing protein [Planctomycetota bacterium]
MRRDSGFTLIELLVVMGIIVVLVGLMIPGIRIARRSAKKTQATSAILSLATALSSYNSDFGDYPPSTLRDVDITTNRVNDGNESLVACLSTGRMNGPYYEFEDEFLVNRDNDKVPNFNRSVFKTGKAFEYLDPWGNPYIYFHNRDYDRPDVASRYWFATKKNVRAKPSKSKKKGAYHGLTSYQLWSAGPDGENDNGKDDDIGSWQGH